MPEKLQGGIRWLSVFLAACLLLLAGCLLFFRYPTMLSDPGYKPPQDFQVYIKARELVNSGNSPYEPNIHLTYKYAPGILIVLDLLPKDARMSWIVFSIITLLVWMTMLALGADYHTPTQALSLAMGLLMSWKGSLETFDFGQFEFWCLSLSIAAAMAMRRFPAVSGLLLGTLPWIKLPWGFLLLPFLTYYYSQHRWSRLSQFFGGFFFTSFIWLVALPGLTWGPEVAFKYSQEWVTLLRSQPNHLFNSDFNQSILGTLTRWAELLHISLSWTLPAALAVLGVLFGMLVSRRLKDSLEQGASGTSRTPLAWVTPWLLFMNLLSPISWRWSSCLMVGVPFVMGETRLRDRGILWWSGLIVMIGLYALQLNPIVRALGFEHWTSLHPYGVITGYWLVALLLIV
ncbi:MAG: DUF2029 domain-containing protein [Xanthomonadaceae bacterium]|nr:DUF2029 domain-containing protein [Xanthomonadaceae bacterium]